MDESFPSFCYTVLLGVDGIFASEVNIYTLHLPMNQPL